MPSYTLTYFPAKGAAEISRLIFACAGVDYEDKRVTGQEWAGEKPYSPTGAAPFLKIDDGTFSQSLAIARYLANEFGLAGNSAEERLRADMVVDTLKLDIAQKFMTAHFEKDEEKKKVMAKEAGEKAKTLFGLLNSKCIAGTGYFLASGISWADLMLFNIVTDLLPLASQNLEINIQLEQYPELKKIYDNVAAHPNVKKWVESRPQTNF